MSRNLHKKRYSGESDSYSDCSDSCKEGNCNQCQACIVCPPPDYREPYDTESSDHSCPDFSDLCDDEPRTCGKDKKKEHKEKKYKKHHKDHKRGSKKCGCDHGCGGCVSPCNPCNNDHSDSSVLNDLSVTEYSDSECPDLRGINCDLKRKCRKDKCESGSESSESHNSSSDSHSSSSGSHGSSSGSNKESSESESESHKSSGRGKKFIVSFGSKGGHAWEEYNHKSNESIHINGKNGPVLHLYRGCVYFFCIEKCSNSGHEFVLTNSPVGGKNAKSIVGGFEPISEGCVGFKVTKSTPRYFFYQDTQHKYLGGLVIVHDN